ncbi:ABC transporter ATP-binding protein [Natronomonas amylolytica]|uniref:ABC transporter ATP-binding protein n=1 Tax=Natronomonas amylolytica TaxID=3108498 RepID=UPI00300BC207
MLELSDVHTYYGESHVLKGVSLTVGDGEVVGLVGRNGAGKTTTLRSITGTQPPRNGTIRFEGDDITATDVAATSRLGIRIALEDRRPFPDLTVRENLKLSKDTTYGTDWTFDRVLDVLPRLEERLDQQATHLSGGEQQMLVIAQALLGNPKLIMLDEPMEGLAPQIVERIVDLIAEIKKAGIPILLVEQNFETCLELMDRGYLIHKGEIKFSGSKAEFEDIPEEVERYLGVKV